VPEQFGGFLGELEPRERARHIRTCPDGRGNAHKPRELEDPLNIRIGTRENHSPAARPESAVEPHEQTKCGTIGVLNVGQIKNDVATSGGEAGAQLLLKLRDNSGVDISGELDHARGGVCVCFYLKRGHAVDPFYASGSLRSVSPRKRTTRTATSSRRSVCTNLRTADFSL